MTTNFKIGDVVQLKSGGPKMTVSAIDKGKVFTKWFAGAKSESSYFPLEALILVEDDDKK